MVKSFIGYVRLRVLPGKSVSYHGAVRMVVAFYLLAVPVRED